MCFLYRQSISIVYESKFKYIYRYFIKIDRCFVSRIQYNAYNYRLLSNMIELAHNAQIQVCCEGVETEEELAVLQELRTDILQGFLFAKPYRAEEIEKIYFSIFALYAVETFLSFATRMIYWD